MLPASGPRFAAWIGCCVVIASQLAWLPKANAAEAAGRSLFVVGRDGTNLRHVGQLTGYDTLGAPRWSHDGRALVFDGRKLDATKNRIFSVGIDGQGLREVAPGGFADWSPDDQQFIFAAAANDSMKQGIYVQNVDGRGRQFLTPGTQPRWSPDGSRVAVRAPHLVVYDMVDGSTRDVLKTTKFKPGFDWSPDGSQLAVVLEGEGEPSEVAIENVESGESRTRWSGPALDVAWSPDGKDLAVSVKNAAGEHRIAILPVEGESDPVEIPGQRGDNREAAWSPDGSKLAFAGSQRDIPLTTLELAESAAMLELVRAHDKGGTVYSVGLTPDGRMAFIGGDMTNRGVEIWDPATGAVLRRITNIGVFVAVSPDGKHAACAPFLGGRVDLINLEDGTKVDSFDHGTTVTCLDFSGDGGRLVTAGADKAACTFDVASRERLTRVEHPANIQRVAFSPDGKLIAVTCADNKLHLWNSETGEKVREFDHPACPWGVAFSPDGAHVATGTGGVLTGRPPDLMIKAEPDNSVRIWEVASGKLVQELKGHTHTISSIDYAPDGRRIVTAGLDRTLRLWDAGSGAELDRIDGEGWFTEAVFASNGSLVLAGGGAEKRFNERRWYEYPNERVRLFRVVSGEHAPAE